MAPIVAVMAERGALLVEGVGDERVARRERVLRWAPLTGALSVVSVVMIGGMLSAKSVDPASGGCTAAPHEALGNHFLQLAVFALAPLTVVIGIVSLLRGPLSARVSGAAAVIVVGICIVVLLSGFSGAGILSDFYCGK